MERKDIRQVAEQKLGLDEDLTFHEAVQFLATVLPSANKVLFRRGEGIERSRGFFELLDNPQDRFSAVHIAGTSGKGTVAHMIESLLRHTGSKTGLHTSPHVYDIRERCMVNGELPLEQDYAHTVSRLIAPILAMEHTESGRPTYFEATNAAAFLTFAEQGVDYGVIETGLGGLYDSTNTISRSDKLAVITKLGLDHTEVLGDTIEKIAYQKAGILPKDGDAIVWRPDEPKALETLRSVAIERHTTLYFVDSTHFTITNSQSDSMEMTYHDDRRTIRNIRLPAGGTYQAENATVAIRTLLFLAERDDLTLEDSEIHRAMSDVVMPGRHEKTHLFDREVILDGAHNPQKIAAFLETIDSSNKKPVFVVALKKTKEAQEIFDLIAPVASHIVVTQFFTQQDGVLANFAYKALELGDIASNMSDVPVVVHEDNLQALIDACGTAVDNQQVIVLGSFYLLGEIRDRLYAQGIL